MAKRSDRAHDREDPASDAAPAQSTEELVAAAEAAVSKPPPAEWRQVVSFVCARCGRQRRSQAHLNMVCRECAAAG